MEAAFVELVGRGDVLEFSFAGGTDRAIARRGFVAAGIDPDETQIDRFLDLYLEGLGAQLVQSEGYRVFEGGRALLDRIDGRPNVAIGLGTGNIERGAYLKLARGGLRERFSFGGFGCDHEERARLIAAGAERGASRLGCPRERCRVIVIGDTPHDIDAARAIGAECLAVATGPHSADELTRSGATRAVNDLADPGAWELLGFE